MKQRPVEIILTHYRALYKDTKSRKKKQELLDQFCKKFNYHRKAACRTLNGVAKDRYGKKSGRKPIYKDPVLEEVLKSIWLSTDQICSKKLESALPAWLFHYEQEYKILEETTRHKLLSMSSSSIDRLLKPLRSKLLRKRFCTTKPGGLIKAKIPIKTDMWDITRPGFVEGDTVAHCGNSINGDFVWTLTLTDIHSLWTENRATFGKGSGGIVDAMKDIEEALPFLLLGFDSDNGTEFLNYALIRYFDDRPENKKVIFTRSRPYYKNDNAHVEQKNWTHVRQLYGYVRFSHSAVITLMNDLYKNEWSALQNYFIPSMKLLKKEKINSKYRKHYDTPKTPYQRLLESEHMSEDEKNKLKEKYKTLSPFKLRKDIEKKLKIIMAYAKYPVISRAKI